jgi:hypothetical protein
MGYVSTRFILRRRNAWVAVSLGTIAILANLSNLTEKAYGFFFFYLLAAILLLAQTNLARHYHWFKKHGKKYPARGMTYFMASVLCLSLLTVSAAWRVPEVRVNQLEALINTKMSPTKDVEDYWMNLFAAVPAKHPSLTSHRQEELFFGRPFDLSDSVLFVITAKQPAYWRTRVYDVYTSRGWGSSPATEHELRQGIPGDEGEDSSNRSQLTYSVVTNLRTDILLTAGEFVSSDTPALLQTLDPLSFDINLTSPSADTSLPPDVRSLRFSLLKTSAPQDQELGLNQIRQLLPEDLTLTGIGDAGSPPTEAAYQSISDSGQLTAIQVTRRPTGGRDVVAAITPHLLKPNQRYILTSSVASATPDDLSEAGEDYPRPITDYYLQLPSLPLEVRLLGATITKEAESPYEKALAIKRHLSQIPYNYNTEAEVPPAGFDGVEYFLFAQQSGNCVDFASAMIVMLRSAGVPSRLAIGYLPGEWDKASGSFVLRAKHYHAWPEVYFPSYGWVGLEATPGTERAVGGLARDAGDIEDDDEGLFGIGETPRGFEPNLFFAIIGFILLVFIVGSAYYYQLRIFIGPDYPSKVYARMCLFASLVKLGPRPQQTPLEYCARLTSVFPLQAEAIGNIAQIYQERRFAQRKELGVQSKESLLQSWRKLYPVLLTRLFPWRR